MEAPLVFPDIDRRIAALAVAVLCALLLAYFAYAWADSARRRARQADEMAMEAYEIATAAHRIAMRADTRLQDRSPRRVKQRK